MEERVTDNLTLAEVQVYMAERGVTYSIRTLSDHFPGVRFPQAVKVGTRWMVPLAGLRQFVDNWLQQKAKEREKQRDYGRRYRARQRHEFICRRCEMLSYELDGDDLCPLCREELAGHYRWYPLNSAIVTAGPYVCNWEGVR